MPGTEDKGQIFIFLWSHSILVKKSVYHISMDLFLDVRFYSLACVSILRPVPRCLDYSSFSLSSETGKCDSSNFILVQYCFIYLGFSYFCVMFRTSLSISLKKPPRIPIGIAFLQISLGSAAILTRLSLVIHTQGMSSTCCVLCVCSATQSWPTLCDPMDCSPLGSSVHGDSPGKNTGGGCHALLQGLLPTQGSNPGLPHCRRILYQLSCQGSPCVQDF